MLTTYSGAVFRADIATEMSAFMLTDRGGGIVSQEFSPEPRVSRGASQLLYLCALSYGDSGVGLCSLSFSPG